MSPSSPDALYHPIPQTPVASLPILSSDDPDIDLDDEQERDTALRPPPIVDSRIRWINFILGCAVLLPWNALITATPYFLSRLSDSPLKSTFNSYLSTTFTAANFIFLARATATSKQLSPSRVTTVSLLALAGLNLLLTLSTTIALSPGLFFAFVILNGIAQASFGSYLQNSIMAVASLFGHTAVQPLLSGQAAVAVAVSTVQVLSATAAVGRETSRNEDSPPDDGKAEERSAFIFFGLSTLFLLFSAVAQWYLVSMPEYQQVAGSLEPGKRIGRDHGTADENRALVSSGRASDERARIWEVAKKNVSFEISVAYVFVVTLAVFPPITATIQPTSPNVHPLLFTSIHFLMFGLGDFVGRSLCSIPKLLIWSSRKLLTMSLARTAFIVLFLLCNVQRPSSSPIPVAPIISSDFLFMFILFAFGVSNGYVSTMALISASSLEHNHRLKGRVELVDVAATVSQFCLVGGLVLGSIASFPVRGAVCACNPFTN
ncbi:hypothetical protein K435DRAFT_104157 [Dendrothele bispora CBS 962.96]|uniref:Nucleoside transporter n=1 Tax=Dendrothele bispora (strain CBS 962.96) TaxID=1314807 RepID=A0A4S8MQQ8_DENBC|nr:hypothetical protein K435DRAFT_104157 [Dendrothele bispora CBS 962.96]